MMPSFGIGPRVGLREFQRTFAYSGRSTRSEVISFWIVAIILGVTLHFAGLVALGSMGIAPDMILGIVFLICAVPWLALMIRRLHDEDYSGWWFAAFLAVWALAALLSDDNQRNPTNLSGNVSLVLGFLVSLAHLIISFAPGSHGANRYGPDPRLAPETVQAPE